MKKAITLFIIIVIFLQGCEKDMNVHEVSIGDIPLFKQLNLTKEEEDYLQEIKDSKTLNVAMRKLKAVYYPEGDKISGYHYKVIKHFADSLNVELKVHEVDISNYFEIDGTVPPRVKEDVELIYSPDLFEEVEIYCDTLTPLPWREKLVKFIPFLPIREVVVHNDDILIETIEDLNNKTIAFQTDSSYGNTLKQLEEDFDFSFNLVHTDTTTEPFELVVSGEVDLTIVDSDKAIIESSNSDNLKIGIPVTDIQLIGWAVRKDNNIMASILEKYIDYMINSGTLDAYWTEVYDAPFKSYLTYLDALDIRKTDIEISDILNLTDTEAEYIEELITKGELSVALRGVADGYNYNLIKEFTNLLDIQLRTENVVLEEYFIKKGYSIDNVKSNPSISYTPDLLQEVDVYCASLTVLPWREQLLTFVPIFEVRELIVSNTNDIAKNISDLDGQIVATVTGSAYEHSLSDLEINNEITIEYMFMPDRAGTIQAVESEEAYVTVMDSNLALLEITKYEKLTISFPISGTLKVGWAVSKDNEVLASILSKYIEYAKISDLFNSFWYKEYGYTYFDYIKTLNLFD